MKLGEKIQQLRKKSGLSQEQLAAQLTVSRQAVSKWELDDAVPDTENVVQLSRIFGVTCDYLLREELDEPGAAPAPAVQDLPQPTAPGETHLNEKGWTHNAFVLSLGLCALGLVGGFMFYRFNGHTVRPLAIGFLIQLLGVALFELAAPRMGDRRHTARLSFYAIACWLALPQPLVLAFGWVLEQLAWNGTPLRALTYYFAAYLLSSSAVTAVLLFLRRRQRAKT